MTAITSEHLELAALAAGCLIEPGLPPQVLARTYREGGKTVELYREWRPHTDIADAARLAVRLHMRTDVDDLSAFASAEPYPDDISWLWDGGVCVDHDGTADDKERAYCEAITLCAAEIGRRAREDRP